jgi:hypothetical protein
MADKHAVHLMMNEDDITLLNRLFELGKAKSKEQITRAQRFPSETIRSSVTIKRHQELISHIEELQSHIAENALW